MGNAFWSSQYSMDDCPFLFSIMVTNMMHMCSCVPACLSKKKSSNLVNCMEDFQSNHVSVWGWKILHEKLLVIVLGHSWPDQVSCSATRVHLKPMSLVHVRLSHVRVEKLWSTKYYSLWSKITGAYFGSKGVLLEKLFFFPCGDQIAVYCERLELKPWDAKPAASFPKKA